MLAGQGLNVELGIRRSEHTTGRSILTKLNVKLSAVDRNLVSSYAVLIDTSSPLQ